MNRMKWLNNKVIEMNRMKVNKYNEKKEMESNNTKPSSLDVLKEIRELWNEFMNLKTGTVKEPKKVFDFRFLLVEPPVFIWPIRVPYHDNGLKI